MGLKMKTRRLTRSSFGLPTQVAFLTTLALVIVMFSLTAIQLSMFKKNLQEALFGEQKIFTASIADNLNQQLTTLKNALLSSARSVTASDVASSEAAQRYLETNAGLNAIFERSVFLFSPTGALIAERPFLPNRRGQDFSWRDYNRDALRTRGPVISEPFITTKGDRNVVIMFATPVFSKDGSNIIAINTGSFGLTNPVLLGNISKTVIGKSGFMYIVTKDGKLVMHPDRSLLLERAYAPNANPLFENALLGFEGTGISIESNGRKAICTFKRIPATEWILATVYPEDEAYASFDELVLNLRLIFIFSAIASCGLVWFLSRHLVKNIQAKNEILKKMKAESLNQLRIKTQFFNEASHDFKQRLHGIQCLINTAERSTGKQSAPGILNKFKSALIDLQRYLNNFLEITRLETISTQPNIQNVKLQATFQALELQFAENAENRNVSLTFRATKISLITDEVLLLRILENLISNAIKFSRGKVLIAARNRFDGVNIVVIDNGNGIDEADQGKIFNEFFQSSKNNITNSQTSGFGLGLSIVMRLAKILDAKIHIRSKLQHGTTIKIVFPAVPVPP